MSSKKNKSVKPTNNRPTPNKQGISSKSADAAKKGALGKNTPPTDPNQLRMIRIAAAVVIVLIVAGIVLQFPGRTSRPPPARQACRPWWRR